MAAVLALATALARDEGDALAGPPLAGLVAERVSICL